MHDKYKLISYPLREFPPPGKHKHAKENLELWIANVDQH